MLVSLSFPLLLSCALPQQGRGMDATEAAPALSSRVRFVENAGQWAPDLRFVARAVRGGPVGFFEDSWEVRTAVTTLRFRPESRGRSECPVRLGAEAPLGARFHFFSGSDVRIEAARSFGRLRYHLRPGLELVFRDASPRASATARLEYDVEVRDARLLASFAMCVSGARSLSIDPASGDLICATEHGELRHSAPRTFGLTANGSRVALRSRFVLLGHDRYGFELTDAFDGPLVVDPGLVWSSYLGGSGRTEGIFDLHVAKDGSTYVCGFTDSIVFPVTSGAAQARYGGGNLDAFVAKIAPDGRQLLWCSFLGGNQEDSLISMAMASDGSLWTCGYSSSTNFPTQRALQTSLGGGQADAVLVRWSDKGRLLLSTYLGGSQREVARGIAFDAVGKVYVAGITSSADYPTTQGVYQTVNLGAWDAFATCIDPAAPKILWSTFVGGQGFDDLWGVDVSGSGEVSLALTTQSRALPTSVGAITPKWSGGAADGYLIRLDANGSKRVAASYLGGGGDDRLNRIQALPDGSLALVGWSDSKSLPTAHAFRAAPAGNYDGYAALVDRDFKTLIWGTYLGGSSNDYLWDVHVDSVGTWTVAGLSYSADFPVTAGSYKQTLGRSGSNGGDVAIARLVPWLRPASRQLTYASFIGGGDYDYGYALDVDAQQALVGGETASLNYETTPGAFQQKQGGGTGEGMVTRLDLLPSSCTRYGASSPCGDDLLLEPTTHATRGNVNFAMLSSGAPPSSVGVLALGVATTIGTPVLGAVLYLDLRAPILTFPLASDASGNVDLKIPLPMQSLRFAMQAFYLRTTTCRPGGAFVSTAAIDIFVR